MPQVTIVPIGESAAVALPTAVLESIGLRVGDVADVTLGERELIIRPVADARCESVQELTREVLGSRQDAYRRLA